MFTQTINLEEKIALLKEQLANQKNQIQELTKRIERLEQLQKIEKPITQSQIPFGSIAVASTMFATANASNEEKEMSHSIHLNNFKI